MRSVPSAPLVGPFAERLLTLDFPSLPADRRAAAVAFTIRRVDGLPSVMRLGVTVIAALFRVLLALPGSDTTLRLVARTPLPLAGEYVRMVRSLGYAYVFETWPDTRADGSSAASAAVTAPAAVAGVGA
jgi:hypothetical protein